MLVLKGREAQQLERLAGARSSWRVLNLHLTTAGLQDAGRPSHLRFFQSQPLNHALLIKHKIREHERALFDAAPALATKVLMPLDGRSFGQGAVALFVGERSYKSVMRQWLGLKTQTDHFPGPISPDAALLERLDKLPTFDPFLLGELLRGGAYGVAEDYLQVSLLDDARIRSFIVQEVTPLVVMAGGDVARVPRFVDAMFGPRLDKAAADFMTSLGLPESRWPSIVAAWKGALRFEIGLTPLQQRFSTRIRHLRATRIFGFSSHLSREDADEARDRIYALARRAFAAVSKAAVRFGTERRAQIIASEKITDLGAYLGDLPDAVTQFVNSQAVAEHILSFWELMMRPADDSGVSADALLRLEHDLNEIEAHVVRYSAHAGATPMRMLNVA